MTARQFFLNMFYLGFFLFSISILLPFNFRNVPFIIFSVVTIYFFSKPKSNNEKEYTTILVANTIYFFFMLISIFYTGNLSEGGENLLRIFPLIIVPLTFYTVYTRNNINQAVSRDRLFKFFFISTILFFLAILIYTFFNGYITKTYLLHYPERIAVKFGKYSMHPLYASMFVVISLIFSTAIFKALKRGHAKVLFFISIAFLFCQLILLARKGPILITALIFLLYFISLKNRKAVLYFILSIIFFLGLIFLNQSLKDRFFEFASALSSSGFASPGSTSTRIRIYNFSLDAILNAPIFGYGIGDVKDILSQYYIENNSTYFNSHNQFLGAWLSSGVMGLFSLLAVFVIGFKKAIKTKDFVYFSILFLFFSMALIENYIERQNGVLLFSFFINFFAFESRNNHNKKGVNAE